MPLAGDQSLGASTSGVIAASIGDTSAAQERIVWIDYARGVGIILVVLGHVIRGLRIEKVGPTLLYYDRLDDLIYSFHMPLFFFLAGLVFGPRIGTSPRDFVRSTVIGLIVPYILWSFAFVMIQDSVRYEVNHAYDVSELVWMWRYPIAHLWFLYALFFARVVSYVVARLFGATGLMIAAAIWMIAFLSGGPGHWLDRVAPGLDMGGAFLLLGMVMSAQARLSISFRLTALAAMAAFVIWAVANIYLVRGAVVGWPQLAAIAGTMMTVAACLLLRNWRGPAAATLAQIGQASLAIYVAHVIFAAALRILLYRFDLFNCTLHVVAGTLVGTLIPAVLFVMATRLKLSPYIGFGRTQKFLYVAPQLKSV